MKTDFHIAPAPLPVETLRATPHMVVCAWCSGIMAPGREPASHGICKDCHREHFPEPGKGDPR